MNLDLKNKNALVAGSSKGIGKATAIQLSKLGASVTLLARNRESLDQVLQELDLSSDQKHQVLVADFSNPNDLKKVINGHIREGNEYHILVNNTGGPSGGPIIEAKLTAFANTFTQHLLCNQVLAQAVFQGMKDAGYGRIINVISTSVKQPINNLGVSNTIRGAVANWAKTLANEIGPFGITVNNVLPGFTDTGRLKEIIENKAIVTGNSKEQVVKTMERTVPLRRIAQPEEIANAISFLATPAASYINGINVPVDGGRTGNL
ncbi:MAG: 3-oxoacyl-[acyl-carrier protein] reductase [Patiriisocius sp.]|jgi:3-oxoacyl-[acyl-carrier protein] reductase